MANWGKPAFSTEVALEDKQAIWSRVKAETRGDGLIMWPYNDQVATGYPPQEVQELCVNCSYWQNIRLSMKGVPTHEKLAILKTYWDCHIDTREREVQVGNYLGALRRGGQLDEHNRIRKWI